MIYKKTVDMDITPAVGFDVPGSYTTGSTGAYERLAAAWDLTRSEGR